MHLRVIAGGFELPIALEHRRSELRRMFQRGTNRREASSRIARRHGSMCSKP